MNVLIHLKDGSTKQFSPDAQVIWAGGAIEVHYEGWVTFYPAADVESVVVPPRNEKPGFSAVIQ